jgi:hypothetical protein
MEDCNMGRILTLASSFLFSSLAAVSVASASESQAAYSLMLGVPTLGSASIEVANQVNTSRAVGVAADALLGLGYSTSDGNTAAMHVSLGVFEKSFHSASGYLQYGVGVAVQGDPFFGDDEEVGLGANLKFGNDWKTSSGFVIGAEWLGASVVVSKSRATLLARLPSLRVGWAF